MIQVAARKNPAEPACLVVKNEQEFYSYIEGRLRDEGFELLETSPGMGWSQCLSAQAYSG
jgi:hypothetical protein